MRVALLFSLTLVCSQLQAQGCLIEGRSERVEVTLCQQNGNIPEELFRDGFCAPQLAGQQVAVRFVEQCPGGAFGICRNARVSNFPYRQDIHYYGVPSDARFLRPACEQASDGQWDEPG